MTRVTTLTSALIMAGIMVGASVAGAGAQQTFNSGQSFFIDGNDPVSQHTRDQVDAYIDHLEVLEQEEARRRERYELFIYNDHIHSSVPLSIGRF